MQIKWQNAVANISTIIVPTSAGKYDRSENYSAYFELNYLYRSQHECDCGKPCSFESATIKIDENLCVVDKNEKVETERKMEDLEEQIRTLRDRIRSLEGENEGLIEDAMAYRIMRDNVVAADAAHNIVMPANRPEIGNNGNVNGNGHYSDSD